MQIAIDHHAAINAIFVTVKIGYNATCIADVPDSCIKLAFSRSASFTLSFIIGLRPTSVATVTKSWLFAHKIGYNSALEIIARFLYQSGGFRSRGLQWYHSNTTLTDHCCHGNQFLHITTKVGGSRVDLS